MIKQKQILVLGYFGNKTNQLDGQTVKTRNIYDLFKKYSKSDISFFDTQSFQESKLNVIKLTKVITNADIIYYLPAQKNLKYIFPIVWSLSKFSHAKLNYLVVGGWLEEFLKGKPLHKLLLSKIDGIYVETDTLHKGLLSLGLKNVFKLHNFRMNPYPKIELSEFPKSKIRLVFMARVHPQKGVDTLFELERELQHQGLENISIDIYGPIAKGYEKYFCDKIKDSSINYNGKLSPEIIHSVLKDYDVLLFPTKYYTEGFPGTILDSYISGVPVISTDWLNAKEFIEEGVTGYISPFNDDQAFIEKVIHVLKDPNSIKVMKHSVLKLRDKYSAENAWNTLQTSI